MPSIHSPSKHFRSNNSVPDTEMNSRWFLTSCRLGEVARHTWADKTIKEPQPVLFPRSGQALWESRSGDKELFPSLRRTRLNLVLKWGWELGEGGSSVSLQKEQNVQRQEGTEEPLPEPRVNSAEERPRLCVGSRGRWGSEAWPRMLVKV